MSSTIRIEIPCDMDGFADLQCPHCGERFRLRPDDYESDDVPCVYCPACGLSQDIHYSDDIMDYAQSVAAMEAERTIAEALRGFGTMAPHLRHPGEPPCPNDFTMQDVEFACCGRHAKLKPLTACAGAFCPYCGDYPMNNNNIELKRTIREFRVRASQLANAEWRCYAVELAGFLDYIKQTPCLIDFIRVCGPCSRDWSEVVNRPPSQRPAEKSDFSTNPQTRTAELFSFLEYLLEIQIDLVGFSLHYSFETECAQTVKAMHNALAGRLIAELELHLLELADAAEADLKTNAGTSLSINNVEMMNLAQGHSTINANLNITSPKIDELISRLDAISKAAVRELPEEKENIQSSVEEAKEAIRTGGTWSKIKSKLLAFKGAVCGSSAFVKAVIELMAIAQKMFP